MSSSASHEARTSARVPSQATNSGAIRHSRQRILSRHTEVALFAVSATLVISFAGTRPKSWIESTAPSELIETCGSKASVSACRAYSIDDGRATSMSPATSMRLSSAGTPSTTSAR